MRQKGIIIKSFYLMNFQPFLNQRLNYNTMTKEDILKPYIEHSSNMFDEPKDIVEDCNCYLAMEVYAKQESIEFFKWYVLKMIAFIVYLKDIKPIVTSQEVEEKLLEFEGQSIERLYELYLNSKQ